VRANDAVSPRKAGTWHQVSVAQPPDLESLHVRLDYPAYTGLAPEELPGGYDRVEAVLGTRVSLRGTMDRAVTRAWIQFEPVYPPLYVTAFALPLASQNSLDSLPLVKASQAAWLRLPVRLTAEGKQLAADLIPQLSGSYYLCWEDSMGLGQRRPFAVKVNPDPAPDVKLECLSLARSSAMVTPAATLSLQITATDPEYGVKAVYLEYRRRDKDGKDLDDHWHTIPLYDNQDLGRTIPQTVFSALARLPLPLAGSPLKLPGKRLVLFERWPLQGLVEEGNILLLRAAADDFDDVSTGKQPGRSSPALELQVVSAEGLKPVVEDAMRQVRDDVTRLSEMQEKARKLVAAAEQQQRTTGKLRPEDINQLAEARDIQKQIQERIGKDREEGLQKDVDRARRMLEDNQLPRSSANDKLDNVARALRRLTTETDQLNQIQDLLEKARKAEEEGGDKRKPEDQRNRELTQARLRQEDVQKTLQGLLEDLTPYVTAQEMTGKTRNLLREQEDLHKLTQQLRRQVDDNEKGKLDQAQRDQLKADLQKAAERQLRLADRAKQLLDEMAQAGHQRQETDPELAKKLERAVEEANKTPLANQMKDAGNDLQPGEKSDRIQSQPSNATTNQQGSVQTLKRMLRVLEEQREDELDRLSKKQQREQEKLDDLQDRLRKLQKDVQAAKQIKDEKLRKKKLRQLAEEQRRIQEDVDQMVKRLTRAQAHEAAQELRRASRKLEESARQMDDGNDPQKEQQEALDRLNDAAKELEKANNRVERELARLRQAKMAEEIKRLKARQDAGIEEMKLLHKDLLAQNKWDSDLIRTLSRLKMDRQDGLATDTAALAKKLEAAPVFAHILGKTVKAMKKAVTRMGRRQDTAKDERFSRPLTREEIADENKAQEEILALQREASRRLDRLLEALKEDPPGGQQQPPPGGQQPPPGGDQDGGPPPANQDGIPTLAEQKALRAEQAEVNDRTKNFDERHPELEKLSPEEKLKKLIGKDRAELEEIHDDQKKVHDFAKKLFSAA
jgi:hypothetical protein